MSNHKEGRSLSSIFSFILPSPIFGKSRENECTDEGNTTIFHSFKWKDEHFSVGDETLNKHSEYEFEIERKATYENRLCRSSVKDFTKQHIHMDNGQPDSAKSNASGSSVYEDALDSPSFSNSIPNLTEDSVFICPALYAFFDSSIPNLVKGCQWVLLYSTAKHGISLRTLFRKSGELSGPCLLITGDKKGAVFGGLLESPLKPTGKRKYQGTNQTFVFTTLYGAPVLFRPTGANRYFYLCMNDLLAIGGGGNFALCMDGDMLRGTSGPCETFGNLCLAHDQEFELKNVELWGFNHASKYIT
ncbi:hypothetical protein LIER_26137 [Lithospermum erythrorhizon]|uniref:TLDc domain-containing protein n=1 Tax=Lithospermum erythrorhizon TaxID=34254 RepID=A0AAV3R7K6_LITER